MGGGGAEKPVTSQTSTVQLSPEQKAIFGKAFPHVEAYADSPLEYKGRDIAGFDPSELAAHGQYFQSAGSGAEAAEAAKRAHGVLTDPGQMLDVANNPYVQGAGTAIQNQVTKNLMEKILPGVRSGATMAGGMYSGGNTGEAITTGQAIGDTGGNIANALADLNYRAYSTGLGTMNEAVRNTGGVQAASLFSPDVFSAVGGQKRAMEQAILDKNLTDFYGMKEMPYVRAQQLLGLISGMPGGTTVNTATGALPPPNKLMEALFTPGAAIGMLLGKK